MPKAPVAAVQIHKIQPQSAEIADDLLAVEEPLEIRIGFGPANDRQQKSISVTMRTPAHDFELALGFLFTEGIIQHAGDIDQIRYCTEANTLENQENIVRVELNPHLSIDFKKLERHFYTSSSCGVCGKASIESLESQCSLQVLHPEWQVNHQLIYSLPQLLRKQQNVFEYTGGLHACALFDLSGNLLLLREDVGRHNALDKLIGAALGSENQNTLLLPLEQHILLLSGRASFELLQKAAMAGIQLVCAVGAPSSLAVEVAKKLDITLIGFLRDERFNIYSGAQRIKP